VAAEECEAVGPVAVTADNCVDLGELSPFLDYSDLGKDAFAQLLTRALLREAVNGRMPPFTVRLTTYGVFPIHWLGFCHDINTRLEPHHTVYKVLSIHRINPGERPGFIEVSVGVLGLEDFV
jgi:hypothetical protein